MDMLLNAFTTMLVTLDPPGMAPIFLGLTAGMSRAQRKTVALRGKDGSMDEAVEAINDERGLIFRAFALGLTGNLCTVLSACFLVMENPTSTIASIIVLFTAWTIYSNATRIQRKFLITETIRLDDLTRFQPQPAITTQVDTFTSSSSSSDPLIGTTGNRNRKSAAFDLV